MNCKLMQNIFGLRYPVLCFAAFFLQLQSFSTFIPFRWGLEGGVMRGLEGGVMILLVNRFWNEVHPNYISQLAAYNDGQYSYVRYLTNFQC
jgi:hypothetical protein